MKKIFNTVLISTSLLCLLAGCGDDDDEAPVSNPATTGQQPQQPEPERGIFKATMSSINTTVAGNTSGAAEITINGDNITIRTQVNGAPVATHAQHIHIGTTCPTPANDTNGDGIVDGVEASAISGKVLIPLDDDINSQDAGKDVYPVGPVYLYDESGSYAQMLSDLTAADPNPNDPLVKLPAGSTQIGLVGKVIKIHGVPPTTNLPNTVASGDPTKSPHEDLPISCGVISKVQL